jgi:hypothetical protein
MYSLIFFLVLFFTNPAPAQDLAVMLFIADEAAGDKLFKENLQDLGFKRLYTKFKSDYHVSLGYIDDVEDYEVEQVQEYVSKALFEQLNTNITFEFGAVTTLGRNVPFIVAIPANPEIFLQLNNTLAQAMVNFKFHKYKLKKISTQNNYIPHLSLNAQIYKEIPILELSSVLNRLNQRLKGKVVVLDRLVIR